MRWNLPRSVIYKRKEAVKYCQSGSSILVNDNSRYIPKGMARDCFLKVYWQGNIERKETRELIGNYLVLFSDKRRKYVIHNNCLWLGGYIWFQLTYCCVWNDSSNWKYVIAKFRTPVVTFIKFFLVFPKKNIIDN